MTCNKAKFILLALFSMVATAWAQQVPQLPIDPAVRHGKLPNGLTYYIRHNAEPKGQANFYIAQKVGSVQEEEAQRGLAHFLEHMAFNGSKHFAPGQLVKYCEGIGVKFGANLNAYTSTDETVYNIDNVPMVGSNLDSCLYILADWSGGLSLLDKEIDKERGVIHEEWRMRTTGAMRIYERQLPNLYPGSRYGHRMPIGLMSVVDAFKPEELRAYYHKWYRPDLQGIVVVGDVNVDEVEAKIKTILGAIEMPAGAAKYETYPVPANNEPIYIVDKDKELGTSSISVFYKHEPLPRELRGTPIFLAQRYVNNAIASAINERLSEMSRKADCPFNSASVGYDNYLVSKQADAFTVTVVPKPTRDVEAFRVVMQEVERAARHGITGTELYRVKENILSSMEATYNNREKQKHNFYTHQYVRHFLEGNAIPDLETEYQLYKTLTQQIPLEAINAQLKEYTAKVDTNFVVLAIYPEKEGVYVPTVDELRQAVAEARATKLEAYVDNVKNEPLIAKLPKVGKVKKSSVAPFGYTKLTLSNGANIYYKVTDFNASQVLLHANSFGGSYKFADKDVLNGKLVDDVMGSVGLGNFTSSELSKKLAGKQASLSTSIGRYTEGLSGSSTPKDLRTLFELIYLSFTAPGKDVEAYKSYMADLRTQLANAEKLPQQAFRDSITSTLYANHPRFTGLHLSDLDKANFETIRRLYTERFKSPSDFDFYFTGAINVDSLRLFAEQYIASIPAAGKREQYTDLGLDSRRGQIENRFRRVMETPQAMLLQAWKGDTKYSLRQDIVAQVFGQVLNKRLLKSIREDGGMAYSVNASASVDFGVKESYSLQIFCPFTPEKVDSVLLLMQQGVEEIAKEGARPDELEEIKKFENKQYTEAQRSNSYWQGLISSLNLWKQDQQKGYVELLNAVTSDDVKAFAKDFLLKDKNCATIIMLPEEKK